MAKGVTISIKGLTELKKKFSQLPKGFIDEVDAEMSAVSLEFVHDAAQAAPVDTGLLKNSISFERLGVMQYEIVSAAPYSAYVEFGTIEKVNVPSEWKEFAQLFKGKGLRKTGGIHPHPFFFPQVNPARNKLKDKIPKALVKAMK